MRETERLAALVQHLHSKGVGARLALESRKGLFGGDTAYPVILPAGQEVDRLEVRRYEAHGSYWFSCHFGLLLDEPLAEESREAVGARTEVIKKHRLLGMFGDKIVGIRWVGGRISEALNQDTDISKMLVDLAQDWRVRKVLISPQGEATVGIVCPDIPDWDAPWPLTGTRKDYYFGQALNLDWLTLLGLCNRIARHVRHVASVPRVPAYAG